MKNCIIQKLLLLSQLRHYVNVKARKLFYGAHILPHINYACTLWDGPQWGAADAEIKVPSGENTELKRSPFHAWSRSVYSHTCYAYCQGFLPCLFLPFLSIHLHFFQNLSRFFPVLACRIKQVTLLDAGSRVECPRHINRLKKHDLWKDDDL